ncbi:MAG: Bifunctional nuclease family protein [Nitrospira sp.]|nr:bifunctional nuclease family protein [Nitrospira sp.]ULA62034.1 MAG: Bifunctional nuclease family protein [Nitrospira sp.]
MIATARRWLVGPLFSLLLGFSVTDVLVYADEPGPSPQVTISHVRVGLSDHGPVVLLSADGKTIPVFVDHTVAASIQAALTGEKLPRPLSHDLMHTILEALGGRVVQTVITLKAGTYYGSLTVAFQGQEKVFDSRSSDSIALAIHFHAPILVGRDMLDAVGKSSLEPKPETL